MNSTEILYDPFLDEERVLQRLREELLRFGKIIIAYDFDYTINSYRNELWEYPTVIQLLKDWKDYAHFICYSASPEERYDEIRAKAKEKDVPLDYVNTNIPGVQDPQRAKIYYNVFLDDRAGLGQTVRILRKLIDEVMTGKLVIPDRNEKGENLLESAAFTEEDYRRLNRQKRDKLINQEYYLYGFINSKGSNPAYLRPVFQNEEKYYIQDIESCLIKSFRKIEPFLEDLIPSSQEITVSIGQKAYYAFSFPCGDILVDTRENYLNVLRERVGELNAFPITAMEILMLLGEYDKARRLANDSISKEEYKYACESLKYGLVELQKRIQSEKESNK